MQYVFSENFSHNFVEIWFFLDVVSVQFYIESRGNNNIDTSLTIYAKSEHRIAKHILWFYLEMLSEGALCYWRHTYRRLSTTAEWTQTQTQIQIHKYMHNTTCMWLDIDIEYNYREGFACMTLKDAQIHTLSSIMHSLPRAYLQKTMHLWK